MPQLPEDIIDRLNQMERRLKALSTAVNTRPAVNEFRPTPSESVTITRPLFRIFDGYNHVLHGAFLGEQPGEGVRQPAGAVVGDEHGGDDVSRKLRS